LVLPLTAPAPGSVIRRASQVSHQQDTGDHQDDRQDGHRTVGCLLGEHQRRADDPLP